MNDVGFGQARPAPRPTLIFAEHLQPDFCCPSCNRQVEESNDTAEEELNKFATCCGIKRRQCCGGFYFPPRRSHNSHQSYAHILTPITIILACISGLAVYAMFNYHDYIHKNLKMLPVVMLMTSTLMTLTIILAGLCVMSWWKSCTCYHYEFMGDFEETERNYWIGFGAANDIEEGKSTLAFFSTVSPFEDKDDVASKFGFGNSDVEYVDHESLMPSTSNGQAPSEDDLNATAKYLEQSRLAFYDKIDKLERAKSAIAIAESTPLMMCCFGKIVNVPH